MRRFLLACLRACFACYRNGKESRRNRGTPHNGKSFGEGGNYDYIIQIPIGREIIPNAMQKKERKGNKHNRV